MEGERMNAIKAIWTNGQIVPTEPVNWPEGSQLRVEPEPKSEKIGLTEDEWRDEPEAIAEWVAWVDTIEPLIMTDEERADLERYREEHRRFNIEAVRRQMGFGEQT
jgi:predicted DNA-binding antitoxin AbrB/MazE fold protein